MKQNIEGYDFEMEKVKSNNAVEIDGDSSDEE